MKWLWYLVLIVLVGAAWGFYIRQVRATDSLEKQLELVMENGDPEELGPGLKQQIHAAEGVRTFNGILLTFLSAGLVGIIFVVHLLPFFAQRLTHAVYDSGEMVERDGMSGARSLLAQGDYEGAIEAFKEAAAADPLNRMPWMEMAKIYKDHLEDPAAAIATIRTALESQEWETNDAAYFLFRLAELYDEVEGDRASAVAIMNQVVEEFPETRHSANAQHKLHEWSVQAAGSAGEEEPASEGEPAGQATTLESEEEELLARLREAEAAEEAGGVVAENGGTRDSEEPPPAGEADPERRI